jgi:hypothetical protein
MFLLLVVFATPFLCINSNAQSIDDFASFGTFTAAEDALQQITFDKDANAVIIHHIARTDYTDQYEMITEHRVKIKVLNDKGVGAGDIRIHFYSGEGLEDVRGIEAVVKSFEKSGETKTTPLDSKSVYTVKVNKYYSDIRFALPNIKAGSIFEYHYYVYNRSFNPRRWDFQAELPTIVNFYRLAVPPNAEFTYKVYKLKEYPIQVNNKEAGFVNFKMSNMPGLRDEAYMDAEEDNLQHVTFQLSAYNRNGSKIVNVVNWDQVAPEILDWPEVGSQLNKSLKGTDEFVKTTKLITDPAERVKAVLKLVQGKMSWNGFTSLAAHDGIKNAWDKGTGNVADINLIFINLLRQVDITAIPLLVNNRDDGKIDINYPFINQFSKTISYIKLAGRIMIIDASDERTPMHMLPRQLLNTYGYKVDKKDFGLILLEDESLYYENKITINAIVSPEGVLTGNTIAQSFDYARLPRKEQYKKLDRAKYLENYFSQDYSDLIADSLEVTNLDKDSLPLNQTFKFKQTLNQSGDYLYFDYHFFDGLRKNPFISDIRFSDINFGSPLRTSLTMTVNLPDNYTLDALPKSTGMRTSDTSFQFMRSLKNENGTVTIQILFEINQSYFERAAYSTLQTFYKKLYGLLSEQIVLKKK